MPEAGEFVRHGLDEPGDQVRKHLDRAKHVTARRRAHVLPGFASYGGRAAGHVGDLTAGDRPAVEQHGRPGHGPPPPGALADEHLLDEVKRCLDFPEVVRQRLG